MESFKCENEGPGRYSRRLLHSRPKPTWKVGDTTIVRSRHAKRVPGEDPLRLRRSPADADPPGGQYVIRQHEDGWIVENDGRFVRFFKGEGAAQRASAEAARNQRAAGRARANLL